MTFDTLIVISKEDVASCNIKRALLELGEWDEHRVFGTEPGYARGTALMVTIDTIHLYYDNIDEKVRETLMFKPDLVIYASRHRSESKIRTLTVHPIGNFTEAKFGGVPNTLVPTAPRKMTAALRALAREGAGLGHQISFEATHHGPLLSTPTFFIEIGSDESAWPEVPPAQAIARTLLGVLDEPENTADRIAIGIGGGHYLPRLSDIARSHHIAFGHMIPTYALDMPLEIYRSAIERTPGAECVYFHKKAMAKADLRRLEQWFEEEAGLEVVDSKALESIQ